MILLISLFCNFAMLVGFSSHLPALILSILDIRSLNAIFLIELTSKIIESRKLTLFIIQAVEIKI